MNVDASPLAVVPMMVVPVSAPPMAMLVMTVTTPVADFLNAGRILHVGALAGQRAGALRGGEQQSGGDTDGGECFIHRVFLSCFVAGVQHTSPAMGSDVLKRIARLLRHRFAAYDRTRRFLSG